MKLENSTTWTDSFLRKMIAWCCREVGLPVRHIKRATFRNCSPAYRGRGWRYRILVSVGPDSKFPVVDKSNSIVGTVADRLEALILVTAHELQHANQYRESRITDLKRRRSCERDARNAEGRALLQFRRDRHWLLPEWESVPESRQPKPKPSKREQNAERAAKNLERWQKKLKLAQTKVRKYRASVRRYERSGIIAARGTK